MRASFGVLQQFHQWLHRPVDGRQLLRRQPLQPFGEPGGSTRADGAEHTFGLVGQRQDVASAVAHVGDARDQPRLLQPIDVAGHRSRRDPLELGQLARADALAFVDLDHQRNLATRDAKDVNLAPELPSELQQDGPEPICERRCLRLLNSYFKIVSHVNDHSTRGARPAKPLSSASFSLPPRRADTRTMAFRRRPPQRTPGPVPPDEQVTLVEGAPPPPPPDLPPEPPPREPDRYLWPWLALLLVLLAVGGGLAAYFATRDDNDKKTVTVPRVVGSKEADAVDRVKRSGLDPNVSRTFSDQPAGLVIAQRPTSGAKLDRGQVVSLTVSNGPSSVAVPNLVSLSEADAITALTDAGLRADVFQVPSTQKAGKVVAQNPTAGEKVPKASTVRLNVSKGQTQTTTVVTTAPTVTNTRTSTSTVTTVTTTTPTLTSFTTTVPPSP